MYKPDQLHLFYSRASPFSQFYPCVFTDEHLTFNCTEQYMMYMKAKTFKDDVTAHKIMQESRPLFIKRLGRTVRPFNDKKWNNVAVNIVKRGNMLKFHQNPDLLKILIETGDKILVEASPRDKKWGIGMGAKNPNIYDKTKWGTNLLGFILMEVRDEIQ